MSNYKKNTILTLAAQLFSAPSNILSTIILVYGFGTYNFGTVAIAQAYLYLCDSIFNLHSSDSIIQYQKKDNVDSASFIDSLGICYFIENIQNAIGFFLSIILVNPIGVFLNWDIQTITISHILIFSFLFNINGSVLGTLRSNQHFTSISIHTIITSILYVLVVFFSVIVFKTNTISVVILITFVNFIKNLSLTFLAIYFIKKDYSIKGFYFFKSSFSQAKELLKNIYWNNFSYIVDSPIRYMDVLFLSSLSGETVGIYKALQQLFYIISMVGIAISQTSFPEIAYLIGNKSFIKAKVLVKKIIKMEKLFLGLFLLFFIPVSFVVISRKVDIINKNWIDYLFISIGLLFYNGYSFIYSIIHPTFLSFGYFRKNFFITLITNSLFIFLAILGVKNFGVVGLLFSLCIQAVINVSIKKKILKL
ncbi:lipopolysaccharide biosynthesis protein [Enterococcus diestrammenae]|uniref:Polysaccharide biosynthesis protein n=1 Tax=Enterococcus diestrammenae TaxID=1155073 RepID=A0ABV0F1R9_9ENTE|nr:oligosaccharide flippase family protein [Enterococcus diestrammenae]KAF1298805.1 hypothetical protein BAU18_06055 [Enterococcus diestrammenae]